MDSDYEVLLFYTAVRWLSKRNVVNRVFELKDEIKLFLKVQGKNDLFVYFNDKAWLKRVAYLADILEQQIVLPETSGKGNEYYRISR